MMPSEESTVTPENYTRATLNILEDFSEERDRFAGTQKAIINILDDFGAEKTRLEETEKAVMNILEDFDSEKQKVEAANRDLLLKTSELARSNAELEQFAYVASHDLQEPLRMVSSYVQLFAKRYAGEVDEQADKYIAYAVEGAKRMQMLIGGLLEYSRLGREELQPRMLDLGLVVGEALQNLKATLEETQAEVTCDPMPVVSGDASQLLQVLQNLIANADKFRRPGQRPHIHLSARRAEPVWLISVKDDGIGIPSEFFERVFIIFQRLHTRAEYPGTGIGLSICKKVIERHGGHIWVESEPGQGTTFVFSLPIAGGL